MPPVVALSTTTGASLVSPTQSTLSTATVARTSTVSAGERPALLLVALPATMQVRHAATRASGTRVAALATRTPALGVAQAPADVQAGFIKKVCAFFSLHLLVALLIAIPLQHLNCTTLHTHLWVGVLCSGVWMRAVDVNECMSEAMKKFPGNYFFLVVLCNALVACGIVTAILTHPHMSAHLHTICVGLAGAAGTPARGTIAAGPATRRRCDMPSRRARTIVETY